MSTRYAPHLPLPRRAFVPGAGDPHPRSEPRVVDVDRLSLDDALGYGADLFNAGFPWEAHEAFERAWHLCGREGAAADAARGLVRLSASFVKEKQGNARGVAAHARGALELFERAEAAGGTLRLGIEARSLLALARQRAEGASGARCSIVLTRRGDVSG